MPLSKVVSNSLSLTTLTSSGAGSIQGLTVGRGAGAVATNTAFGASALAANTTGAQNTAVGASALQSNTTASNNTVVGYQAALSNTTGNQHAVFGRNALNANTTGTEHTAIGHGALAANTTGNYSSALGNGALNANTTGSNNVAIGNSALVAATTASNNTAVGYQSLFVNTTGTNNTAVGASAGDSNTTGGQNTFIGRNTGNAVTTGSYNTMVGYAAGNVATTGTNNTFIGSGSAGSAGEAITTGAKNVILGAYTGNQGGLDIRTASNYIVLSDGDGNPRAWIGAGNSNDLFRVGTVSTSTSGWMHQISYSQTSRYALAVTNDTSAANPSGLLVRYPNSSGASNTDYLFSGENSGGLRAGFYNNGGVANFSANNVNLSDRREKTNFTPSKSYLETVCAIPVQTFNYVDQDLENDPGLTLGVVAQDVQAVAPELVMESNWGTKEAPKMRLSIYQTDLQYALMKCIQEQQALITQQATAITTLTTRITALEQA